jgi:hypothetical protein
VACSGQPGQGSSFAAVPGTHELLLRKQRKGGGGPCLGCSLGRGRRPAATAPAPLPSPPVLLPLWPRLRPRERELAAREDRGRCSSPGCATGGLGEVVAGGGRGWAEVTWWRECPGVKGERGWVGNQGLKKLDKWTPQVLVGIEQEIQGTTGAEKLMLYCKILMTRGNILF